MEDIIKAYQNMLDSHTNKLSKLNERLNAPSSIGQLMMAKGVLLREKAKLHIYNRLDYTDGALDFMQKDFDAVHKQYSDLMNRMDFEIEKLKSKPLQQLNNGIPEVLNTSQFMELLNKAIQNNLVDTSNNVYRFNGTKALMSYFADKVSDYLDLGKGEYGGNKKISWKPFEILFNTNGLAGAKRDYQKVGNLPTDHKKVDVLFE